MCVICVQPKGEYLDRATALEMWKTNPDGGGFSYITDEGHIHTEKHMAFKDWWGSFEFHRSTNRDKDFLVHMRIATHGKVSLDNVHPFVVNDHTVMAHNGIIHSVDDDPENELSDTRIFIRDVLPEFPNNWLDSTYLSSMVADWVGWSKLAFLTTDPELEGTVYVVNQSKGDWENGMWFSNLNHVKKTYSNKGSVSQQSSYYQRTNYKGGRAAGQVWDKNERRWSDVPDKDKMIPSEDLIVQDGKEYASLQEYWADKDREEAEAAQDMGKFGQSWPESHRPWSTTITTTEKKELTPIYEQVKELREACEFPKPIVYDDEFGYWWCFGCDEEVDVNTGICDCWDKYCIECTFVAAQCECPLGYSQNLTSGVNIFSQNNERSLHDLPQPF